MKFDFTGIAPRTKLKTSKDAIIERIDDGKVW
jgi:hypothetical protein